MAIDIEEELLAHDTDLTRRAARYIRIKRGTITGLEQQLRRCREIMECNDPGNARDLFSEQPALETLPSLICSACGADRSREIGCNGGRIDCPIGGTAQSATGTCPVCGWPEGHCHVGCTASNREVTP